LVWTIKYSETALGHQSGVCDDESKIANQAIDAISTLQKENSEEKPPKVIAPPHVVAFASESARTKAARCHIPSNKQLKSDEILDMSGFEHWKQNLRNRITYFCCLFEPIRYRCIPDKFLYLQQLCRGRRRSHDQCDADYKLDKTYLGCW
jgi:hypothetical protein